MNIRSSNNGNHLWQRAADLAFWAAVIYVCVYKLWLSAALPFSIPMLMPADETWFFKMAYSIYTGNWFGETYNHHTLIKAPVYPLFLSFLANLGIHPKIALDLLYTGASLIFLAALRTTLHNRIALFIAFILVLVNPVTFSNYWTVPLRLNLFMPLVLIYLSAILALIAHASAAKPTMPLLWSLLCSVSLALAWYTREEAVWMIAALAPLAWLSLRCFRGRTQSVQVLTFWLLIFLLPYFLGSVVASINKDKYGFDGVQDTKAPEYSRAMGAIYSLNTVDDHSNKYFTFETRDKMLAISNNTQRVFEILIDPTHGGYKHFGKSIGGGRASWSIRDAMAIIGYYKDPVSTESAYKVIADDIEKYCRQQPGNCRSMYMSGVLIKPVSWLYFSTTVRNSTENLLNFKPFPPAARAGKRERGDYKYQYFANRLFNFNTSWNPALEQNIDILSTEKKRIRKIDRIYAFYQNNFWILALLALLSTIVAFFSKPVEPKFIGLLLFGSCAASYSVYLLVSLFAVPGFSRLLAIVSVPLLVLVAYYLAFLWQQSVGWAFSKLRRT